MKTPRKVAKAIEVIRQSLECDDNKAWDALDVIISHIDRLEQPGKLPSVKKTKVLK